MFEREQRTRPDAEHDPHLEDAEISARVRGGLRSILRLSSDFDIDARSPVDLGLSSLGAITLQYQIRMTCNVEVAVSEILSAASVAGLVDLALLRRATGLSSGQEGMLL